MRNLDHGFAFLIPEEPSDVSFLEMDWKSVAGLRGYNKQVYLNLGPSMTESCPRQSTSLHSNRRHVSSCRLRTCCGQRQKMICFWNARNVWQDLKHTSTCLKAPSKYYKCTSNLQQHKAPTLPCTCQNWIHQGYCYSASFTCTQRRMCGKNPSTTWAQLENTSNIPSKVQTAMPLILRMELKRAHGKNHAKTSNAPQT